jgi:NADH-quinone oxidoreductase subunit L
LYAVLFLPLAGAILNRLFGARLGKKAVAALACGSVAVAFALAAASFVELAGLDPNARRILLHVYEILSVGNFSVGFDLLLDPLSAVMINVVTGIGLLIHIYSSAYMEEEDDFHYARYFSYLNFFVFSMLTLVLAANFLVLFVGWELVGVSSYLLIGFYRTKTSAADAGKKAFITNRVGDLGFLLAIFIIMSVFGTLDFGQVFSHPELLLGGGAGGHPTTTLATVTALLLFMGAMGKSAQLPLHVWLPDAMEGPTPVSALIHAATMVTAGVYMVARCHALFELSPLAMSTVAWIGAATALFAATIALVQNDIKRVMAYSTLSQLGYMVMGVGVGAYTAGFFHLFTHAFFKALLFLGCGSIMHALHGELDMTRMGGLRKKLPITHATMLVGALCLAGVPGTSGFFSKDEILLQALSGPHGNIGLWGMGFLASMGTAFYVGRFIFKIFYGETRLDPHRWEHVHESAPAMAVPLVVLAVGSLAVGVLGLPHFVTHWQPFAQWLAPLFDVGHSGGAAAQLVREVTKGDESALAIRLIVLYTGVVLFFGWLTWRWFGQRSEIPERIAERLRYVHQILWNKYYVDELYNLVFVRGLLGLARWLHKWVDQGLIDGAVNASAWLAQSGGDFVRARLHNGYARFYAGALLGGVILVLALALRYGGVAGGAH